jgi:hypothetical protein
MVAMLVWLDAIVYYVRNSSNNEEKKSELIRSSLLTYMIRKVLLMRQ